MTALERMAKAALEAHQRAFRAKFPLPEGAVPDGTWETLAPEYREQHIDTMRAALTAIREPSEATLRVIPEPAFRPDGALFFARAIDHILNGGE